MKSGERSFVRARLGVLLAAGGFAANDAMPADHALRLLGANLVGTDRDDGTAIRKGQSVGAAVKQAAAAS